MKKAILTTKVGMTQIFNEDGVLVPVTVLQAGPCVVTQVKTVENDGYSAVQVGFVDKKDKVVNKDASGKKQIVHRHGVNKAEQGHFKKAGVSSKRYVREFKFENAEEYTLGAEIKADIFAAGDKVDASAISKGKGFQGAIKRFGQHRGPMAHGSKFHRHQGSIQNKWVLVYKLEHKIVGFIIFELTASTFLNANGSITNGTLRRLDRKSVV